RVDLATGIEDSTTEPPEIALRQRHSCFGGRPGETTDSGQLVHVTSLRSGARLPKLRGSQRLEIRCWLPRLRDDLGWAGQVRPATARRQEGALVRSVEEQQARISAAAVAPRPIRVAIAEAQGLLCAEEVVTERPLPGFDQAAIDGYAVRSVDVLG